jgi:TonB-dependent starch-binding outer membrane protein SusC
MVTKLNSLGRLLGFLILLLSGVSAMAQKTVTGTVKGDDGEPLVGASVVVKGTAKGGVTDIDGKYSVDAPADATLVVSFVGYSPQEIAIGNQSVVDATLTSATLSEVVVTGYSTQSRRDITGSVAVIDTKDMKKYAGSNIAEQLQGKIAGVQVGTNGDPGSSAFVRIRGIGSINNNEPLYVIDGIPVQSETNLNFLNPNDIESLQVLKDASSASIYGARAANGVVIITTKKGKLGVSKINFDIFTGIQNPPSSAFPAVCTPQQLLDLNKGLSAGSGQPFSSKLYPNGNLPDFIYRGGGTSGGALSGSAVVDPAKYFLNPDPLGLSDDNYLIQAANKTGTDWGRALINSAPITNYQLSASGASDKGSYFMSGNFYDNEGILVFNNYKRYQARANTVFNIKKNIRVGETMNVAYQTSIGGVGNPNEGSVLKNLISIPSIVPLTDIKGNPGGAYGTNSNAGQPYIQQYRNASNNKGYSMRVLGSAFLEADFFKYFTAKTQVGLDFGEGHSKGYGPRNWESTEVNSANNIYENFYNNTNWVFTNTLKFSKEVVSNIRLDALVGYEARNNNYVGFNAGGSKLAFGDDPNFRLISNVDGKTYNLGGYEGSNSKVSQFGKVDANLFDKYLISATVRRDGSSRFLNNRYGVFPGGSVGWRISKEDFMQGVPAITELKLRAGYGVTGNDEASGDYPGYTTFYQSSGQTSYDISGTGNSTKTGFDIGSVGNPDLKWESTSMLNLGFDATLFKSLDVVFEWYNRKTTDMIYPVALPWTQYGRLSIDKNIGSMSNKGVDLQINYRGKTNVKDFDYTVGVTVSKYKNEVLGLDANGNTFVTSGGGRLGDVTRTEKGYPISSYYGYVQQGLWGSAAEIASTLKKNAGDAKIGRFKFADLNGDGEISDKDFTYIGSPHPKLLYGLNIGAHYKGFDITAYIQGVYGNKIFNYLKYYSSTPAFQANYLATMLTEAGKTLPVLDGNDNYSNQRSSWYVEDGSYIRGRNFQVGYTVPTNVLTKYGIDKLRLYIQGQNIFTITKYSGYDPDVTISNITEGYNGRRDYSLGLDYGRYPTPQSLIFGLNVEF